MLKYSFIIPVYNRPQEIKELLDSFTCLSFPGVFEIVIVEDGSTLSCKHILQDYKDLQINYFYKPNSGPGDSRNFGMQKATGNYFIILDSDCILPQNYLAEVDSHLKTAYLDCFGGPDAAHKTFTPLQKAINYTMTSYLTTGGIRGKKNGVQRFEPRSFNMGISKAAFAASGGFSKIHPGEDPDLSQRLIKLGFSTGFIENAYVYHKRRISFKKFYQQVYKFGLVRPILNLWHPVSSKPTFWLPSLFVLFTLISIIAVVFKFWYFSLILATYIALVFLESSLKNKSIYIGLLTIITVFIQFFGYGIAFIKSTYFIHIKKENPETCFPKLFFE